MRYRTQVSDSARWDDFEFRESDIVISVPPKCGTTWTQMLCALLIFDGPEFPGPLGRISPWLDSLTLKRDDVYATYAAQTHRRFIKTHTPLDGLPIRADITYIVVGRDPRDVAISMEHHQQNMNMERILQLRAEAAGLDDPKGLPQRFVPKSDPVERFRDFVRGDNFDGPMTLASVLHHLSTAWERRFAANVALFHYADMRADLVEEMARLAHALRIGVQPERLPKLAANASLERMRERAAEVVPNASLGVWRDVRGFFRGSASGEWRKRVSEADEVMYDERVAALAPPDLGRWVHLGRRQSGVDPSLHA